MTKIDIFSGFLGAGKTTLIKKLIAEAYQGEKLVLIENEFGEIAVDGGFLKEAGIEIREMSSGCICCSLVGDFAEALEKVKAEYSPDRVLIEPSGVGKLSDVIRAVQDLGDADLVPGSFTTVVDATRARMYMKNFGEFWCNQVENAGTIVLSRTKGMGEAKLAQCVDMLRAHNPSAVIVTTPWDELDGKVLREAMEREDSLKSELERLAAEADDARRRVLLPTTTGTTMTMSTTTSAATTSMSTSHDHEPGHEHEHHHHHHGHDADEVFTSWGAETARKFTEEEIVSALSQLDSLRLGQAVRAKGYVDSADGQGWIYFDYVPGERELRRGGASVTGRLCVIGANLDEDGLKELFHLA